MGCVIPGGYRGGDYGRGGVDGGCEEYRRGGDRTSPLQGLYRCPSLWVKNPGHSSWHVEGRTNDRGRAAWGSGTVDVVIPGEVIEFDSEHAGDGSRGFARVELDSNPKSLTDDAYSELGYAVHNLVRCVQSQTGFTEAEACEALKNYVNENSVAIASRIRKEEQTSF